MGRNSLVWLIDEVTIHHSQLRWFAGVRGRSWRRVYLTRWRQDAPACYRRWRYTDRGRWLVDAHWLPTTPLHTSSWRHWRDATAATVAAAATVIIIIIIITITSGQRICRQGRIVCRAVIEDWMIHFAAYAAAETPNGLQWARQPPKLPLPIDISTPI